MPEPEPTDTGLSRDAYALLAQANLLRMRGCWQEAIDRCMQVMTLAPNNASAQSLLGDIYDNQGFIDDAIQWYRMALDLQPDSPADEIKLSRLLETKAQHMAAVPAASVPVPRARAVHDPLPSFSSDVLVRWAAAAAGLLVLVVVIVALVQIRAASRVPVHQVSAPPVVLPTLAAPPSEVPTNSPASHDPAEAALLTKIAAAANLVGTGVTPTDVQEDPRAGRLIVTFTLPAPATGTLLRDTILRAALLCAQAAVASTGVDVSLLTLRCVAAPVSGTAPSLLGVGDMTRTAAVGAPSPAALTTQQMAALIGNTWWSSAVPS